MCAMNPRLLRPKASGFNLKSISGLEMWMDGSDSTTMTFNGTAVSEWRDKSGKGNTFTQTTALNQPTFTASARNGRSGLNFPNVAQMNGPSGFSFAQPTTWVMAFQAATTTGTWSLYDGNTSRQHIFGNAPTEMRMFAGSSPVIATLVSSSWYVAALIYNGASSTHRVSTLTASTVNAGANAITGPRIGANNGLRGDLGELAMFSRALSDAEATAVLRYLSKKWDVALT
jgi:hypothetical protein